MLVSGRLVQDGSYLRMKNLMLNYQFPHQWIRKIGLSSLNLYVAGENLWTWTKFKGADPESVSTGYDETYPNARAFTFGLNLSF